MSDTTGGGSAEFEQVLLPPDPKPPLRPPPPDGRTVRLSGDTMGTVWRLSALFPPDLTENKARSVLEGCFSRINGQMSQWETISQITKFNDAPGGTTHRVGAEFARVLDCAIAVAGATGGAFDPTVGAATELWGFGASTPPDLVPDVEEARGTRRYNWRDIRRDRRGRVLFQPGGLTLDFSGIAKGHAVDAGMRALHKIGVYHALFEIGGEMRATGLRADGMPWWVDIENPWGGDVPETRIGLTGWSVATSGSYRRRRQAEGISWSHTLESASGLPVANDILAVTVLHPGCMQADALATAIMALGTDRGMKFANENGVPVRIAHEKQAFESAAWMLWAS